MKEIIILIFFCCVVMIVLQIISMKRRNLEGFFPTNDRTSTRVGPYDGITSCSSWGVRNVHDPNRPIGDDSFVFNGIKKKDQFEFVD